MLRRLLVFVSLLGCLQLCGYRIASLSAMVDDHFPSPQPDTRLYCQAARQVAQGHPFSYSLNAPRCTGTTSVLYPFILSVPYVLGAKGDRLLEVGFWLNGACYLVFLFGWTLAFFRFLGGSRACFLATILLALSGQPAVCAFAQSDTGIWMAVSALWVVSLIYEKWKWVALFAAIAPWIRPEGMYVAVSMGLMCLMSRHWRRSLACPALLGVLSSLGVFGLNHALTGRFQFDSIANKGFLKTQTFAAACVGIAHDAMILFRSYFAGLDENWPRMAFTIPVFGGFFFWLGVFSRKWKIQREFSLACVGLTVLVSFGVLSTSMQLGQNFERYLAWTVPVFIFFTAVGVVRFCRFDWMRRMRKTLIALVMLFYAGAGIACILFFQTASKRAAALDECYRASELAMAAEDARVSRAAPGRVGGYSCAALYDYSERPFRNLAGIYSPEFFDYCRLPLSVELLKHRPDLRFEYWQTYALSQESKVSNLDEVFGPVLLAGPNGMGLRVADWTAFNHGARCPTAPAGMTLKAAVDIGYVEDERQSQYEIVDRWGREPSPVFLAAARLDGKMAVDSGRAVVGFDQMTVELEPGLDCHVTVRALSRKEGFELGHTVKMLVQVNDVEAGTVAYDLEDKSDVFQERTFVIPGRFIRQRTCRVAFLGDHIVCGYWFWQ